MIRPTLLLLQPNRVWRVYLGGKTLDEIENITPSKDGHFPEDWIASTIRAIMIGREKLPDEGLSVVNIENREVFLKDLIEENPHFYLGDHHYKEFGSSLQFLCKFLDSSVRLPVQCHPTREFSRKFLHVPNGKTEVYVILATRPEIDNPYIYLGFQHPPTKSEFKTTVQTQDIEKILGYCEKIPVKAGDIFIVPGGFPHAIGEGIFMIEIMEPTDFTARLEFELGNYVIPEPARFLQRDVDFGISMLNFQKFTSKDVFSRYFIRPRNRIQLSQDSWEDLLIDESNTPCFRVKKWTIHGEIHIQKHSFYVGIVIQGEGTITSEQTRLNVHQFDKFFKSFSSPDITVESEKGIEIIVVFPPII